jgi:hypothetical protein
VGRRISAWTEHFSRNSPDVRSQSLLLSNRVLLRTRDFEASAIEVVFRRPGKRFSETAFVELARHPDPKRALRSLLKEKLEFVSVGGVAEAGKKRTKRSVRGDEKSAAKSWPCSVPRTASAPLLKAPQKLPSKLVSLLAGAGVSLAVLANATCALELPAAANEQYTDQFSRNPPSGRAVENAIKTHPSKTGRQAGRPSAGKNRKQQNREQYERRKLKSRRK